MDRTLITNRMMGIRKIYYTAAAIVILCLSGRDSAAQDGKSLGLGESGAAYSRGTEAIRWNPANLGFIGASSPLEVRIYSFQGGIDNNALNIDLYNKYNGKILTDTDKREILDEIPDGGMKFGGKADVSALSVRFRNFGFSVEAGGYGNGEIARDAFELALFGNASGDSVYSFNGAGSGAGILSFSLSYGYALYRDRKFLLPFGRYVDVKQLNVGATVSVLRGLGYIDLIDSQGQLEIMNGGINVPANFRTREAQGGWGAGVDIGVNLLTTSGLTMGFALDNVLSRIRWSKNPHERIERFDLRQLKYLDEIHDLDLDDYRESEYKEIDGFSDGLPRNFRFGAAQEFRRGMLNVEAARDYNAMRYTGGGGVYISFLELYAGIGVRDGDAFYSAAFAINLKHFYFDIGVRNRSGVTGGSAKGITVANSLKLMF